ncbi:MAG: GNAT family N-acetyltransferase [Fuerstiella sp.]|nr:GNAT family N-acetyltransferase [Fuerstiella sp.]
MQPELLPSAPVKDRFRILADHDDGYCWTVLHRNHPVLQVRGLLNPDDSMDLVCVQQAGLSSEAIHDISNLVLVETQIAASHSQRNFVRCLVESGCPAVSTASLATHGFEPTVRLQAWKYLKGLSGDDDSRIDVRSLSDAVTAYGAGPIEELIAGCLDSSRDLQALGPVTPHSLLSRWRSLPDPELLMAQDQNRLAGLAVVTQDTDAHMVTVEYLGVVKCFRRRGIARRLLKQASFVSTSDPQQSNTNNIVAYCDRENTPAMQLYMTSGFSAREVHTIWQYVVPRSGPEN